MATKKKTAKKPSAAASAKKAAAAAFKAAAAKKKQQEEDENEEISSGEKKKRTRKVLPDGTLQDYMVKDGSVIKAVWRSEKLCCPTCKRKLPVTAPLTDAQRQAKAAEKKKAVLARGQAFFAHFAGLMAEQAKKEGKPAPTPVEVMAALAEGLDNAGDISAAKG